jgi:hypothetical protein
VTALFKTKKRKKEKNNDEKRKESIKIRTEVRRSTRIVAANRVASVI